MRVLILLTLTASQLFVSLAKQTIAGEDARLMTLNGTTHVGKVARFEDSQVRLQKSQPGIPQNNVLRIETGNQPLKDRPTGSMVFLTNGDRLLFDIREVKDDALICATKDNAWGDLSASFAIPLEYVRSFALQPPRASSQFHQMLKAIRNHRDKDDVVRLANGDQITGELLSLDAENVLLQSANGELKVPRNGIQAILMNVELAANVKTPDSYFVISLADGSFVSASELVTNGSRIRCATNFGTQMEIEPSTIVAMYGRGRRIVPLSSVRPLKWNYTPFFAGDRKLAIDTNSNGQTLKLNGRRYSSGLGMHSKSIAVWQLNQQFVGFVADCGIDDRSNGQGDATFRVMIDDKKKFESTRAGTDDGLSTGLINLTAAKRLQLEVDFAAEGDLFDVANWCEPVLIREAAK